MGAATLLVELLTEELPPKALPRLGEAFAQGVAAGLRKRGLATESGAVTSFATPRRLAVSIADVLSASEAQRVEAKLMPVAVGLDAAGKVTPALAKKLAALGLADANPASFKRRLDGKTETLFADTMTRVLPLAQGLQAALDEALAALPVPKVMSYQLADGETTVQFARPAHGLVALHGADVIAVRVLGLDSGRVTHGHRFQGSGAITLANANEYATKLERDGCVIASFAARRDAVRTALVAAAAREAASLGPEADYTALLDEVTALVERPAVYVGRFESEFLSVPAECLILTMRANQRYFPLFGAGGALTERFLIVSNMRLEDPANIVQGNERVVRPRLADARFFFETDRKTKLADRVPLLAPIVYHNKLGSLLERVERLRKLATRIQSHLPRGARGMPYADRAAFLAKADLVTLMVGEFPELQGVMGKYYAQADGEEPSVVRAIEQHYWPRFAGDRLPDGDVSIALALADKLESLTGMFGIGVQPTGDRDPHGLRRHALGVVRILVERNLSLSLNDIVNHAFDVFPREMVGRAVPELLNFIRERFRGYLREAGYTANEVESVLSMNPVELALVPRQLDAVRAFSALPEASSLAAANKRVANILKQAGADGESVANADPASLKENAEKDLFKALMEASRIAKPLFEGGNYGEYLKAFAVLKEPVDAFFVSVMVNVDDPLLRRNRLALLADLRREMNKVADISKLAT